ncbi:AmiS/UreI family transporter [Shewanella sp. GXUN23E]|uniref:AmiS/UreI family transporter n=1 Tax=Shewanella sp. GXUN23E TaxID=3422498 RepID=UPI003D7D62F8
MLGLVLVYVGVVLILNGIGRLIGVDDKSAAVFNVFTGLLSLVVNIIAIIRGDYFAAAAGLLFAFTYLYIAARSMFNLDDRLYGWYCLFVAINTLPLSVIDPNTLGLISMTPGNLIWMAIWLSWGMLWLTGFIELALQRPMGRGVGYFAVFCGIFTAWLPGMLLLLNQFPA